jgi:hypothetical protein
LRGRIAAASVAITSVADQRAERDRALTLSLMSFSIDDACWRVVFVPDGANRSAAWAEGNDARRIDRTADGERRRFARRVRAARDWVPP